MDTLSGFRKAVAASERTELVNRQIDLVYSAALRQVNGDAHLARDVAQPVFIGLSHQAAKLSARKSLAGWLYTSAHHVSCRISDPLNHR